MRRDTVPGATVGSKGRRRAWAPLLPAMLKPLGYRCYHTGKWHIDGQPMQNGFDHSYDLEDHDHNFGPKRHFEDGVALPAVDPKSGFYTTTAMADHAIKCLREHAEKHAGQPFFSYLAFTVPHFPLQAPAEDIARYRERYRRGWDAAELARRENLQWPLDRKRRLSDDVVTNTADADAGATSADHVRNQVRQVLSRNSH